MINIAIVDDEEKHVNILESYLERYAEHNKLAFCVRKFNNAVGFLTEYPRDCDIVFMDIRMQYMDGLTAAKRLREIDNTVVLVFVTSLAQYAINGYEVDATDYIVKPFSYPDFALKMARAVKRIPDDRYSPYFIKSQAGVVRIDLNEVAYVETNGHKVIFHLSDGKEYEQYCSLGSVEKQIRDLGFSRCNSSYLVNLAYVAAIDGFDVKLSDGTQLAISHPKKAAFTRDFLDRNGGK